MDKKQRNKAKRALKKEINRLIGQDVCGSAVFKSESQSWEVWMSVDFDIPVGLDVVKEGMDIDIRQQEVLSHMKEQEQRIVSLMKEQFSAIYKPEKPFDFNYTIPFPPMFSTKRDNGVLRLKTKEEQEKAKVEFPSLVDMIETDEKLLEAGFHEFKGEEANPDLEGFVLVKYAGLRARYTFILPHQEKAEAV
ncbi:hypothetical protein CVD28_03395 [Bacillus sp. M6-12]|uniref:hypothetical protein n=1 Tax=Bacillus sp. M6-12 TaxID=2054166 RepID=UPI000C772FBD|nr:hypothetical protein [Bacillus sp. M6-12]PLS19474.1 hypothetical protein CVD28_03395 [Bacillus sp. M6-12]